MNTNQISKWLGKNNRDFQAISLACGVSIPTLYNLVAEPGKKRQRRIVDAIAKYIDQQKGKK